MKAHVNFDVQPEADRSASGLLSLSIGLILGCGLVIGGGIGALLGHFMLDNAFGWGQDVALGAILGVILIDGLTFIAVMRAYRRMESQE